MRFIVKAASLCVGLLLTACAEEPQQLRITGETMGAAYSVVVADPAAEGRAEEISAAIEDSLREVNALMSNWDPTSEISRFNALQSTASTPISPQLAEVMAAANRIHRASEGQFDVTLGPLIELWGFGARRPETPLPADEEIAAARRSVGQDRVLELSRAPDRLRKTRPEAQAYLAAIAKGYGVDAMAATMRRKGFSNFMVEIGGDLFATGLNARREPWRIGIERPEVGRRAIQEVIRLGDGAGGFARGAGMATSGDYRNFFEQDGVRYSHILDAVTGRPVSHATASVTVIAATAMEADAWATALLALGEARGAAIAERERLAAFFIVREPNSGSFRTLESTRFAALRSQFERP